MKKFLSIFIALAMVLSLFAGVGARSAKAATATLTATPVAGQFAGGVDAVPEVTAAVAEYAEGTVTLGGTPTIGNQVTVSWLTTADAVYAASYTVVAGDSLAAIATKLATAINTASGNVTAAAGSAVVTLTQDVSGVAGNTPITATLTPTGATLTAVASGFAGGANAATPVTAVPAVAATATFTLGGTITAGDEVAVWWQAVGGTGYWWTEYYTVIATDTLATVATKLAALVTGNATAAATGAVVKLTQTTTGAAGNSLQYSVGIVAAGNVFVPVTGITVTGAGNATTVVNGGTLVMSAAVLPANATDATLTWSVAAGTGTATIDSSTRVLTATGVGTVTVTATANDGSGITGTKVITVTAVPVVVGTPVLTLTQPLATTYVKLDWTYAGAAVTGFSIYRNSTGTTPDPAVLAPIYTAAAGTTGTYTDTTTAANQVYYYWVGAVTATGTTLSAPKAISSTAATVVVPVVPVIPGTAAVGTLTLTPAGNFVGGVDGSGALGVDAIGTVVNVTDSTHAVVDVTTAGVGTFDTVNGITVLHNTGVTSIDTDWATTGMKSISFTGSITSIFNVGDTIKVAGSSTKGVGKVISINDAGTLAVVNVTTAVVGTIGPKVYTTSYADSTDLDWLTAGTAQPITFDAAVTLVAGDILDVAMLQAVPGTSATAFLIVSGTPVKGDIATVTWQDTLAASHTVSYTTVTGDTAASVALALSQLIHALDLTTGNVDATVAGNLITLTQDVAGVAGNGKKLTATSTAAVTPTLTIHTVGGLNSPAYVELGKTIKLVAVDATGAVISCTWTSVGSAAPAGPSAVVNAGLVTADLALTGVTVVTATSGSATGVFAVVVIPVQIITSLKINLVPAVPVSTTVQQFGAIASNAAYSALDYTTQAVWTDALPVASIAPTTGCLTYSTDETGNVFASAGGITATANVKIATGVVTLPPVVGPVTKVIVLTIGSDIVTVDGKATTVDSPPAIVAGRTFVPIRFIAETFGSTVTWLPDTKGVTIVLGDTTIGLQIGNATAVINGTIIALEAAPYINPDADRTMVPLRVISESFGGNVAWDPINHIITITYVLPVVPPVA